MTAAPQDDLDALLSLGDVDPKQILALVPSLVRAAGGDVPPEARKLLDRLPSEPRPMHVGEFAPRFSNGHASWG